MGAIDSQITSLTIVYSTIYSDADQRKHESSASLAFVCGIHRGPVNSPHKWPVTRKMSPFDDVIMDIVCSGWWIWCIGYFSPWWRNQMETFFALLALCAGNSPVTGVFPSQRPLTRCLDVFFYLCVNKLLSKQSRRHRAHYDCNAL